MKKKLDRKNYMFEKLQNQVQIKTPGQIDGKDFVIRNCQDCELYVCDFTSQVFVDDSSNCKIFFGPVEGSLFIRDCNNIEINCAASQFRISGSTNITAFVHTQSDPALENAINIILAPYNFTYSGITAHFANAKLNLQNNKWSEVFDFTPNLKLKNWNLMSPNQFPRPVVKEIEGLPDPEPNPTPIPLAYGGQDERPIVIGSVDARSQEKGGQVNFAELMGKQNVLQIMQEKHNDYQDSHQITTQLPEAQKVQSEITYEIQESWFNDIPTIAQQYSLPVLNVVQDDWLNVEPVPQIIQQQMTSQELFITKQEYKESPPLLPPSQLQQQMIAARNKEEAEMVLKKQKQQKAKQWLNNWINDYEQDKQTRKIANRQQQEIISQSRKEEDKQNPWNMICQNINLKESEHKGLKSVNRMREALLNRRKEVHLK